MRKTVLMAAIAGTSVLATPAVASQANGYGVATSASSRDSFTFSSVDSAYRTFGDAGGGLTGMGDVAPIQRVDCAAELANAANNGVIATLI